MKFERGKKPKEALELGIFSPKSFDNLTEAREWVIENHTKILNIDRLCFPNPSPEQFAEIRSFVMKYIIESSNNFSWGEANYLVEGVARRYRELHSTSFRFTPGNIPPLLTFE